MGRVGPWVLGTGLALMVAGIASSALDLWPKVLLEQEAAVPVPVGGAIDIRAMRVDSVTLGARDDAVLRYTMGQAYGAEESPRATWREEGDAWVLEGNLDYGVARQVELEVPAHLSRLAGRRLEVQANARVPALQVQGSQVVWNGDAGTLVLQAVPTAINRCGEAMRDSVISFETGEVEVLRITSAQGGVILGELSRVGDVELRLAPAVSLKVARVDDLERITILPYEDDGAVDPADGAGSPAASIACPPPGSDG